jgi:uncharacterized protein (TIGR04222 family)
MNPFNFSGPAFLFFFLIFIGVVNIALRMWQRHIEANGPMPKLDLSDPYRVAYLRGGAAEALKVAAFALIDRGLLNVNTTNDQLTSVPNAEELVRRPIEKSVLALFRKPTDVTRLFENAELNPACKQYLQELTESRLLYGSGPQPHRFSSVLAASGAIGGVAGIKLLLAIQRGKSNIIFLLILAAVGIFFAWASMISRRSGLGLRFLKDQRTLFGRLQKQAKYIKPGGGSADAVILAALFGLTALPAEAFPFVKKLFPQQSNTDSGSSCGSSGGSSSSCSSGGSGCGGGGGCCGCGS